MRSCGASHPSRSGFPNPRFGCSTRTLPTTESALTSATQSSPQIASVSTFRDVRGRCRRTRRRRRRGLGRSTHRDPGLVRRAPPCPGGRAGRPAAGRARLREPAAPPPAGAHRPAVHPLRACDAAPFLSPSAPRPRRRRRRGRPRPGPPFTAHTFAGAAARAMRSASTTASSTST